MGILPLLEIAVQRQSGTDFPVVAEFWQGEGGLPLRREGILSLDRGVLPFDPLQYGIAIGKALFRDDIRDTFAQAVACGEPVRILLSIECPELRSLHWHRLAAPFDGTWRFLAASQRTPFSLDIPTPASAHFPLIGRRDLRALILVAGPGDLHDSYGLDDFDAPGTIASIRDAMGVIPCDVLAPPTLDALCERLTAERYSLLHVVCHGRSGKDGETLLYLPQETGGRPVKGTEFLARLRGLKSLPHLVFLSTCESAEPGAESGLGGLGQRLIRELGVPAVVAMTEPVSISTARAMAAPFYAHLYQHGQPDLALTESLAGLQGRSDLTVPALFSRLGSRPLFSDSLDRELTDKEIEFGLTELDGLLPERAPAVVEQARAWARNVRGALGVGPSALSPSMGTERAGALESLNNLSLECLDASFKALCLGQPAPAYDARCPFRGLESFRPEDAGFFFGRQQLTERLVQRIKEYPFLAVLGGSGSGKSSLVMAGIIPMLGGEYRIFRPGTEPVQALASALEGAVDHSLLVVDQFEELFTLTRDENLRREFIAGLLQAMGKRRVIVTMRADFLGEVAAYADLRGQFEAHQAIIPSMTPDELREAVQGQASVTGLRFESNLAEQILDDVAGEPGAMPLLQHALWMLWKRRHGRWLEAGEYAAFGGVRQAIASTANDLYASCSEFEQARLQDIFLRLTRLDEGDAGRDTRRRVLLQDLTPAGSDPLGTAMLLQKLADSRLVVKSSEAGKTEVEVAHEALIRHWDRLTGWLKEDRDNLRLREGVSEASRDWEEAGRDDSMLIHRGPRLELALAMSRMPRYQLNPVEQAYLEASIAVREKEKAARERLRRRTVRWLVAGITLISILALFALYEMLLAQEQTRVARVGQLVAESSSLRDTNFQVSLLAGAEAYRKSLVLKHTPSASRQALGRLLDVGQAHPQLERFMNGHTNAVHALVFSRDGGTLISGGWDNKIILWDMASHRSTGELTRQSEGIYGLALSPDGEMLASASGDKTIVLWDLVSHQPIGQPLTGHLDVVFTVAFSPDGKVLASGSRDGTVILWDIPGHKSIGVPLTGHTGEVNTVAFSPDGRILASGGKDRSIILWNLSNGQPTGEPLTGHEESVFDLAFSPDGTMLASGAADGSILLWDVANRKLISDALSGHTGSALTLAFSPDSKILASAGGDNAIILWDMESHQRIGSPLVGHADRVFDLAFSPDGATLASAGEDNTIVLWGVSRDRWIDALLTGHTNTVNSLAFSPDGRILVSGSSDDTIRFWDVPGRQPLGEPLTGHTDTVISIAISPDGSILASGGLDNTIRLWDMASHQPIAEPMIGHKNGVTSVAFSPDGRTLASGSGDWTVRLWDVATRKPIGQPMTGNTDAVGSVKFSPDGKVLASAGFDGSIRLWKVQDRQPIGEPLAQHHERVFSLAFSPDGKILASGSVDNTIILWDMASRRPIGEPIAGHTGTVSSLTFSNQGGTLLSGSWDKTVRLWDVASRQPIGSPLTGHTSAIYAIAFSPDGRTLASGARDTTIHIWKLDPRTLTETACERAGRNFTRAEWVNYFPGEQYRATCPQWPLEAEN